MQFIKDHQKIFETVFPHPIPEGLNINNQNDHSEIEELNPKDAIEVAQFSGDVENWTTWRQQTFFYVCGVPEHNYTFLLFAINWDDNWGCWERQSWGAIHGLSTHENAASSLLKNFAVEHLENADDGEWKKFLLNCACKA